MSELIGIARERVYSPGKVRADRAILEAVAARLRARHEVRLVCVDDTRYEAKTASRGHLVFAMCQGSAALAMLSEWEANGARIVNSPAAIAGCHREPMMAAFRQAGVPHPDTVVVATDDPGELPEWSGEHVWVKRGDVHAMRADDVRRVRGRAAILSQLERLRHRGVTTALIQRHVQGRVIKFYAVAGSFFACFATGTRGRDCRPDEVAATRAVAERGAAALGLEVFGGDVVRRADGTVLLIDLNDWPSYAPCRRAAADAIATYLNAQYPASEM